MATEKNNRVLYIDILNVLSCVSVVCLHANGYIHKFIKDDWWWLHVLVEVLFYFAVPVFFMLSGATLLGYRDRYSTKEFMHKRVLKTFLPFLFWSFLFYGIFAINEGFSALDWREVVGNFATGKIPFTVYWFFIPLFLLYLFMPFLSVMVMHLSSRSLLALCTLLFVFQSLFPTIFYIIGIDYKLNLPIGGYVLYALLGFYFSQKHPSKKSIILIGLLAIAAMTFRYCFLFISDEKDPILFSYFGLYAIFPALFVFLFAKINCPPLIKANTDSKERLSQFWSSLAKLSFGVYLIHKFILAILQKLMDSSDPVFIPIAVLLVYSLSVIVTFVLQKFKLGRYLMP